MSEPDTSTTGKNGVKTLGIRFQPEVHAQLSLIAQLRGHSFQDETIAAVEAHIAASRNDKALLARVTAAYYDGIQRPADLAQLFDVSREAIQVRLAQVGLAEAPLADRRRAASPVRAARYYRSVEMHLLEVAA
jgi:hypothetical protein